MNAKINPRKGSWIPLNERRAAATGILLLLLLLALPAVVQAQFTYTVNSGTITITGYTGPGGDVTIPDRINGDPVTGIGNGAFAYCPSLTNVTIGTNVTSIGYGAFAYCPSLTNVTIPASVTSIWGAAFNSCTSLTAITVDALNSVYSSVDGVLFNKSQTILNQCPGGKTGGYTVPGSVTNIGDDAFAFCGLTHVTILQGVTSIGFAAFDSCTSLTSITIPDSVTSIGDNAFEGCTSLTNVTIPGSVTSIGFATFEFCTSLTSVTIGNGVTSIGVGAFGLCTRLTRVTIPNSVTSIGQGAFNGCTNLTSVTIGTGVTSIGVEAFGGCTSLTAITVDALNSVYSSVDGVLFNKSLTTLIEYAYGKTRSYTIPNSVINIGTNAFFNCTSLTSVTIGNGVTNIGDYAFSGCTTLTNVTIGNGVTNIGNYAFNGCTSLTSITIPTSVTSIGTNALYNCTSLTSVTIGTGVTSIGDSTFSCCWSLRGVYFMGNAPWIGSDVFDNGVRPFPIYDPTTVYYLSGTTGWGTTFGGLPTALWTEVPSIQKQPQTQTAEAGATVGLWARASSPLPLFYLWYLNNTNLISCSTNSGLELTGVQSSQSGAYTVVISNVLGAITSSPALLNVIAPVERRPVPGVQLMGEAGSLLNVDYADSLSPAPTWTPLGSVSLTGTSQYCFDLTLPLPPQRFYRAWQTGTPGAGPSLDLHFVPAITLTGNIGGSVRVDAINRFGPTDAWVTLDTVTLTNTSQLYFDTSSIGQPARLYRLVPSP